MTTAERLTAAEKRITQLEGRIEQLTAQLAAMATPTPPVTPGEPAHPWVRPGWYPPITCDAGPFDGVTTTNFPPATEQERAELETAIERRYRQALVSSGGGA